VTVFGFGKRVVQVISQMHLAQFSVLKWNPILRSFVLFVPHRFKNGKFSVFVLCQCHKLRKTTAHSKSGSRKKYSGPVRITRHNMHASLNEVTLLVFYLSNIASLGGVSSTKPVCEN
jgi:hypothetical protein